MAITNSDLQGIFDTDLSTSSLDEWISISKHQVDEISNQDSSIAQDRLDDIHLLLAAHYASLQDPRLESASRESANLDYQGQTGEDLSATKYGQMAKSLDPTGTLANSAKPGATLSVPETKDYQP